MSVAFVYSKYGRVLYFANFCHVIRLIVELLDHTIEP